MLRFGLQTTTNPISGINGFVEYWYDLEINQWGGPHTWASDCITPLGSSFAVVSNRAQGALYRSDVGLSATTTHTENGQLLQYIFQSSLLAQDDGMAMKAIVESQVNIDFAGATTNAIAQWLTAVNGIVGSATISAINGTYWNQFNWNQANWSAAVYGLRTYNIDWASPVVYKNGAFALMGNCTAGLRVGLARFRTEELEYMNDQVPA